MIRPQLTSIGKEVFERRYRWNNESVTGMFQRVAKHIASAEDEEEREKWEEKFYELMASLKFLPNSPTLFSAGTGKGLLSACFLFVIDDSLESIMECQRLSGLVQKYGGGVGYALSRVRARNAPVNSVQGYACGPVSLLDYYDSIARLITQGGRRAGAQMGILSVEHPDVKSFIVAKNENPQALSTFNISVGLTDDFMTKVKEGDEEAKILFREIAEAAWKTGDPGCYFIDKAEAGNPTPWLGKLEGTNPCGEVPLLHAEACNLGSINISKYVDVKVKDFYWDELAADVMLAVRFLDNVVTVNEFPDPVITEAVSKTRKIGLGVMGWADALADFEIEYDSKEAVDLGKKLISFIRKVADQASLDLADKKGVAPAFMGDNHNVFPQPRNATRLSIAPTGSISILAGCSSGIEPHYELEYTRRMYDHGKEVELHVKEPILEVLEAKGTLFRPKTALKIAPEWHIKQQAAFQDSVDLAVSKTINLPESATVDDIEKAYMMMWELGCKGGTVYRDRCRDNQVLGEQRGAPVLGRKRLPIERTAITRRFTVGGTKGYLTIGHYDDGKPGEIFVNISKEGSTLGGLMDTVALLTSLALQYNIPLDSIANKLAGTSFEPMGFTDDPKIPNATSLVDYIFRLLKLKYGEEADVEQKSGNLCPDCGKPLTYQNGCISCNLCGFSRC